MKTPLLTLLLLAPLPPAALACDSSDCSLNANKTKPAAAAPIAAKPAAASTTPAPIAAPRVDKPRRAPGSRPPAYLFM